MNRTAKRFIKLVVAAVAALVGGVVIAGVGEEFLKRPIKKATLHPNFDHGPA
jgi:hypothetical protein